MSKKKFNDKVELFQELKEHLEELYNQLEAAEVDYNHLEHQDYVNLVTNPFQDLLECVGIYTTNLDNGIYNNNSEEDLDEELED